ncbi:MAG: IPT/TIG domain-containing protein [Acidobacteriia bacterium]|nr:IPT/TIG domain-containing protein [Terriglobia bacterium]
MTAGYRDYNYGTTPLPFPTADKPESKLWWNDGSWWGSLWSTQARAYHIFRFDPSTQNWIDTGTPLDNRQSTLADCLWDDSNQKLYVVSHIFTENSLPSSSSSQWGRLYRFTYGSATKQYTLDSGFPVTVTRGQEENLTVAKDSTAKLWVAYAESSTVMINRSLSADTTWGTPFKLPGNDSAALNMTSDDIASVLAFGGNKIGVLWSNQNTGKFYFAVHNDGDADTVWQPTETALGAPGSACTANCAEDHFNFKADSQGNVYAQVLLGFNAASHGPEPNRVLLRSPDGTWQSYQVTTTTDNWVRPLVLLDEVDNRIYAFGSSPGSGGVIYYKSSALSNINFPSGIGTPFIQSSTDTTINHPSSTKQEVNGTTGLLVLACDQSTLYYLHNFLALAVSNSPVINSFTPTSGAVGASVTINGSKFTGATAVKFNGTSASSFTVNSDTQITTSVPTNATTGPLSVTTPAGTGTSTSNFTVLGPPLISSFTPTSGGVGTSATISGSGFTNTSSVSFNGTSAQFTVNSDTQITTAVPSGATTGSIGITTPIGSTTSSGSFTVIPSPSITSFSPTSGLVGTTVTIAGSHFTGATTVAFNGTSSTFTVASDSQINTSVPSGATTGPISVTTPGGTATSSTSFTVIVPPSISSFSPTSGFEGSSVTISGAGFTGATSVTFNGLAASFTVASDTQIKTTVPSGATTGPIGVTTPVGTATSSSSFTVLHLPVIAYFSPTSGPSGTLVTINGSYFTGTTSVAFNGKKASFSVVSDSQITATVPKRATSGPISVTTPGGTTTSSTNFAVGPTQGPAITSFSPTSGPVGTSVTISGSGFTGATSVAFNGTSAQFTVNSDTQVTTSVPSGATTGPISVTTPAGTGTSSSSFTVVGLPVISSFSPSSGPVSTTVTINGSGFTGASPRPTEQQRVPAASP